MAAMCFAVRVSRAVRLSVVQIPAPCAAIHDLSAVVVAAGAATFPAVVLPVMAVRAQIATTETGSERHEVTQRRHLASPIISRTMQIARSGLALNANSPVSL